MYNSKWEIEVFRNQEEDEEMVWAWKQVEWLSKRYMPPSALIFSVREVWNPGFFFKKTEKMARHYHYCCCFFRVPFFICAVLSFLKLLLICTSWEGERKKRTVCRDWGKNKVFFVFQNERGRKTARTSFTLLVISFIIFLPLSPFFC